MTSYDYQRFVIGGVSAGVRAARVAAGLAARVAIAEDFKYGGTGFIRGCVPKKLLVYVLTPVAILVPLAAPSLSGLNERTLAKLIVDSASQRVLGAHMVGADAGPKSPARCTAVFQAF